MVVLAQQPVSVDCWKSRKRAECQLKWQRQQFPLKPFITKCVRKKGRLWDTNCDLWFGVMKKPPHK